MSDPWTNAPHGPTAARHPRRPTTSIIEVMTQGHWPYRVNSCELIRRLESFSAAIVLNATRPLEYLIMKATRVVAAVGLVSLSAILLAAYGQTGITAITKSHAEPMVDLQGTLRLPADYRTSYQFLGSWAVAADQSQGSKQIHTVYASPGTITAYRKNGHFPDGSVLVKEVFDTQTGAMTTGTVSYALKLKGWFVMVRDSNNSHPGDQLWGDGWGWSWFDAANSSKATTMDFRAECETCHIPARATEWIYVSGYPALQR